MKILIFGSDERGIWQSVHLRLSSRNTSMRGREALAVGAHHDHDGDHHEHGR